MSCLIPNLYLYFDQSHVFNSNTKSNLFSSWTNLFQDGVKVTYIVSKLMMFL